jgi:hypothetical protein
MLEIWAPSWQVRLDGAPARLVRTDLALSGVLVPPGVHHLRFEYRDPRITAGAANSTVTAVAALVVLLVTRRRSRRREAEARASVS